jgi:hypothetical protein
MVGSGDNRHELKRLTIDLGLRRKPSQRVTFTLDLVPMNAPVHYGKIDPCHALAHPQLFDETNVSFASMKTLHFRAQSPADIYVAHYLNSTRIHVVREDAEAGSGQPITLSLYASLHPDGEAKF